MTTSVCERTMPAEVDVDYISTMGNVTKCSDRRATIITVMLHKRRQETISNRYGFIMSFMWHYNHDFVNIGTLFQENNVSFIAVDI